MLPRWSATEQVVILEHQAAFAARDGSAPTGSPRSAVSDQRRRGLPHPLGPIKPFPGPDRQRGHSGQYGRAVGGPGTCTSRAESGELPPGLQGGYRLMTPLPLPDAVALNSGVMGSNTAMISSDA